MRNFIRIDTDSKQIALGQLSFTYIYLNLLYGNTTSANRILSIIESEELEFAEPGIYSFTVEEIMQNASEIWENEVEIDYGKCIVFAEFFLSPHEIWKAGFLILESDLEMPDTHSILTVASCILITGY